jgi:hypothetical protein
MVVAEATTETGEEATGYDSTTYVIDDDGVESESHSDWFDIADKAVAAIQAARAS